MGRLLALLVAFLLPACGDPPPPAPAEPAASKPAPVESPALAESPRSPAPEWAPASPSESGRPSVLLLGIDGAEWDVMDPLIEAGHLPNLGRLVNEGARAELDCVPAMPETACFCPPVWVSIVTGVPYDRHAISTIHHEVGERRAAALWDVLYADGGSTTLVSYRNTWPPEDSARYVLTEYGLDWAASEIYERIPPEKLELRSLVPETRVKPVTLFEDLGIVAMEGTKPRVWKSVARDRVAMEALLRLSPRDRTDLTVVLIHSPDKAQHLGWKAVQATTESSFDAQAVLAQAKAWKGPVRAVRKLPGTNVVSQYLETDVWLGKLLAAVSYDYILVASDHGMTRNTRAEGLPGHHGIESPEGHQGVFVLWGPGVRAGASLEGVDVFDIAPTLAHVLGLAVAEDLPGRALEGSFEDAWRAGHPVQRVASWEPSRRRPDRGRRPPDSDPTPSPSGG